MSVMSCFLCYEYIFFKKQSGKLLELQQDYRTYIGAVNKILRDYNKIKENLEENLLTDQKKKINFKVFSSDDDCTESFLVINRDLEYLRDSALTFINNQNNSNLILDSIDWSDWCEYTDYCLSKISVSDRIRKRAESIKKMPQKRRSSAKTKTTLKKTKKVSSYASLRSNPIKKSRVVDISGIKLSWPIERSRFWMSSLYGPRKKRSGAWGFHYGVDMASIKGTPVRTAFTGIVVEARYASGYGNTIVIAHSRKYRTRYAHLSKIFAKVGQKVRCGKIIGQVGDTGYVRSSKGKDGSHLHFELIEFGKKINPLPFMKS